MLYKGVTQGTMPQGTTADKIKINIQQLIFL